MDSEEPPNVRVACSGDIDEVVRLMHDAAAWMSAKGTPAWDVARIDRTFAETGTVAKLAMRQPFVLFKGLTFQKLCLPGAFRPG
ncbi:hypothetical protein ACRW5H_24215, partial [Escherichia coli]